MSSNGWYDSFLKTLSEKYPKRGQLVEELMDLLHLEREAAYRRLRKTMEFTASEIAKISSTWNISMDAIVGVTSEEFRFRIQLLDYLNPSNENLDTMQLIVQTLDRASKYPDAEYMEVNNRLPRMLASGFPNLNKLIVLKATYLYDEISPVSFAQMAYSGKVSRFASDFYHISKELPKISFVLDERLFDYLITDIRYFHRILVISDEEKEVIRKELYAVIDYLSEIADKGYWPETHNQVSLYISQMNIETSYNYYYFDGETKICSVHAFGKNEMYCLDKALSEKFRTMMQLKKRSSVKISEAGTLSRIEFFSKQRLLVDNL